MRRQKPKPPVNHPDLFSRVARTRPPHVKKTMEMKLPQDKSVHIAKLMVGEQSLGEVQYFLESTSTKRKPIVKIQYITTTAQQKKYGIRLLAHFLLKAKAQNVHHVVADVGEDNYASQRMFDKMGFSLQKTPLGGREREEGAASYIYRYTLDLEHMGTEGIIHRLATALRDNQKRVMQKRIAMQNLPRPPKPKQ